MQVHCTRNLDYLIQLFSHLMYCPDNCTDKEIELVNSPKGHIPSTMTFGPILVPLHHTIDMPTNRVILGKLHNFTSLHFPTC